MKDDNEKDIKTETMEWVKSIVTAVIIAVLIKSFIFNTTYVLGNSMYPTLQEKDRLFANKLTLYFQGPTRGKVIVLEAPDDPKKDYIKRVIGLEGDTIEILSGKVYVNGLMLEENYIEAGSYTHVYDRDTWEVGKEEVFVLGDNRDEGASKDSRYFGTIPLENIKGVTEFRYFPFGENFGKIN